MPAPTRRERAREATISEIKQIARAHLEAEGAAVLSLRAVARDLGMVSSAVYRYFPSRDALLTALIVDSHGALGDVLEAADGAVRRDQFRARWAAVAGAVRGWALAHPADWALLFGTPVPSHSAPDDTTPAGARLPLALVRLLDDAHRAGALATPAAGPTPRALRPSFTRIRQRFAATVPDVALAAGLAAYALLVGAVSLEVFGHTAVLVDDADALFRTEVERAAALVGL